MDPDAALAEMLDASRTVISQGGATDEQATYLAERALALHNWIDKGGFLPASWRATAGGHFYGMSGAEVGGE